MVAVVARLKGKRITIEALRDNRSEFIKDVADIRKDVSETFRPKICKVEYMGRHSDVTVTSMLEEYEKIVESRTRTLAVRKKVLEPLWCEVGLGAVSDEEFTGEVCPLVVEQSKRARDACRDFMDGKDVSGEAVHAMLIQKSSFLKLIDKHFDVEMSFWLGCVGEHGSARIQDAMLVALPGADNDAKSPRQSLALLKQLQDSKLLEFSGMGMKSIVGSIKAMVQSICDDKAPRFDCCSDSAFMKQVKDKLLLFCEHSVSASSDGPSASCFRGKPALDAIFAALKESKTAGQEVGLERLRSATTFAWALSPQDRDSLSEWTKQAVATGAGHPEVAAAAARRLPRRRNTRGSTDNLVDAMFA